MKQEIAPASLARLRVAVERGLADPNFGSQVGLLLMQRRLTPAEAATAFRIGEVYGRFEGQNGLRRSIRSPSYESGLSTGLSRAPLDLIDEETAARLRDIQAQWTTLQDKLDEYPRHVRTELEALCVEDAPVLYSHLPDIARILRKLALFFNSTRSRSKKRKKRATLMIVGRDHIAAPAPVRSESPAPRRIDHERQAWLKVQRKLSPQLSERELTEAYEVFVAMKDREAFNATKTVNREHT